MRVKCDKDGIEKASQILKDGGVVVFPTDTVYGIGCDPYNKDAVDKIYKIKNREKSKPFPVLAYSFDVASEIAEFDEESKRVAKKYWPGALTLLVKLRDQKLKESLGISDKIALRVPDNQCLLNLLKNCKFLIGTSANLSGEGSLSNSEDCFEKITGFDLFLDGGNTPNKGESTILEIDGKKPIIHREGVIKKEEIIDLF